MKKPIVGLFFGFVSLSAILGAAEGDKAAALITPCVALTGAHSRISDREYHRVTSLNEWIGLWQKHKGKQDIPLVDFDRYMVIAIFQGNGWNSAGLEAVSVSEEQERIVFRFDDQHYQTGGGHDGGGKQVTVYGFFVIPRSSKPVVLEEDVQRIIERPAVWKERITFPEL